jgi:hypothetical protein
VKTAAWGAGDVGAALTEVFLRVDELLLLEENRAELQELTGAAEGSGRGCAPGPPP